MDRETIITLGNQTIYKGPPINQDLRVTTRNEKEIRCYRIILDNGRCRIIRDSIEAVKEGESNIQRF